MTRRELREHCFKMLFGADFYPKEEAQNQLEQYFLVPEEEDTTPEGAEIIVHQVDMDEKDSQYLKDRVNTIISLIPELDEKIDQIAQGWSMMRTFRRRWPSMKRWSWPNASAERMRPRSLTGSWQSWCSLWPACIPYPR